MQNNNTTMAIGFALKRSVYQLYSIDQCIEMLSNLFILFDSILLDYEGVNWEFNITALLKLEEFLHNLDTKKRLIYTIGTRANEWDLDTEIGRTRGKKLIEQTQRCKQLFFCLAVGHKAYLTEQEKEKNSKRTINCYTNLLKQLNYQKGWYLAGDNIISLANNISKEFAAVKVILLQSPSVFHEIIKLNNISLSRIGIYGLWVDKILDQHEKLYLERRGVKNFDIHAEEVKSYVITLTTLTTSEYRNIGFIFLFSSALKEEKPLLIPKTT